MPARSAATRLDRGRAWVVVPARDEERLIGRCLAALGEQRGVPPHAFGVLLVLDRCIDATEARARAAGAAAGVRLGVLHARGPGPGAARRTGMDRAGADLLARDRPGGLIACTDADSAVAPDWLAAQFEAVRRGARAIGGRVELWPGVEAALPEPVRRWRAADARRRHARVLAQRVDREAVEHWQFSGASLAVTAETYARVGGIEPCDVLEDEAFERRLRRHGVPIERLSAVRVRTSARLDGRAPRGLANDLASAWGRAALAA